jgi:GAF domain-containing protein
MDDQLARLPDLLQQFLKGSRPLTDTMTEVADLATGAIGCDMAGLTLRDEHGRPSTVVCTSQMVPEMDQAQYDHDRGPCVDASRTQTIMRIDDTTTEGRWPEFAAEAVRQGVRSTHSFPVVVAGAGLGALNFYDRRPGYFLDASEVVGRLFASQTALVASYWNKTDEAEGLRTALSTRAVIEQAKGIIMAATGCSAEQAFDVLRQQSQGENRKLNQIAHEIVDRQRR